MQLKFSFSYSTYLFFFMNFHIVIDFEIHLLVKFPQRYKFRQQLTNFMTGILFYSPWCIFFF